MEDTLKIYKAIEETEVNWKWFRTGYKRLTLLFSYTTEVDTGENEYNFLASANAPKQVKTNW